MSHYVPKYAARDSKRYDDRRAREKAKEKKKKNCAFRDESPAIVKTSR